MKTNACKLPKGFLLSGGRCNKQHFGIGLLYVPQTAIASAVFTSNECKAHPVIIDQKLLKRSKKICAILVNSGSANCANGRKGYKDAIDLQRFVAGLLNIKPDQVLLASTGKIGVDMPVSGIKRKLPGVIKTLQNKSVSSFAKAIMTTDTYPKAFSTNFKIGKGTFKITGVVKGAGMIQPSMATMLGFIFTDAAFSASFLQSALREAVDSSFNIISVDGQMSTNDSVFLLSSAQRGFLDKNKKACQLFKAKLAEICRNLAWEIVNDGEGVNKVFDVEIKSARSKEQAKRLAYAVANSFLLKSAVGGGSLTWGRIVSAMGAQQQGISMQKLSMYLKMNNSVIAIFKKGEPKKGMVNISRFKEMKIIVDLGLGKNGFLVRSGGVTEQYVKINAEY